MSQAIIWDVTKWDRETNVGEPQGWVRAMNVGKENRYPNEKKRGGSTFRNNFGEDEQ